MEPSSDLAVTAISSCTNHFELARVATQKAKMDLNFDGKVVLVTGASAGIGEATAILFAKYGAKLALVGRDSGRLRDVAGRCEGERGNTPLAIIADLATDAGCETVAKETIDHFGKLDVLVNNAAIAALATIQTTDMAVFDRVFNLNVRGVYNLTRLLVPALIQAKGNIVNISSIASTVVAVGSLPYGMAKAAINHFTQLVALELAPRGVRVNCVIPGITRSMLLQRIADISDAEYEAFMSAAGAAVPLGRANAGADVARAVLLLASDASATVTGALLPVDGGAAHAIGDTMPHAHFKRKIF